MGGALRGPPTRQRTSCRVQQLARPADLHVRARCDRCDHFSKKLEWDERGRKTWTEASPNIQAKFTVSGLTAGTTYYFRNRPITKAGPGDWSQVVSLLVH